AVQRVVLALGLFAFWLQRGPRREDARRLALVGLAVCLPALLLVSTVRSYLPMRSFVDLTWYFAIPQAGFALFLVGWWANYAVRLPYLTVGRLLALLVFAAGVQALEQPEILV